MKSIWYLFFFLLAVRSVNSQQKWANSVDRLQIPRLDSPLIQAVIPSFMGGHITDVKQVAEQALKEGFETKESNFQVDSLCLNHTELFLHALMSGERWALQMVDAMGKPSGGLLNGNLKWLGSYDECFAIQATVNTSGVTSTPYTGRYCSATFTVGNGRATLQNPGGTTLMIGICVPNSCSKEDTTALMNILLKLLPINETGLPEPKVICQSQTLEFDTKAIVVIAVCSSFGLLMVLATAYDVLVVRWLRSTRHVLPYIQKTEDKNGIPCNQDKSESYGTADQEHVTSFQSISDSHNNSEVVRNGICGFSNDAIVDSTTKHREGSHRPGKVGQFLLSFSIYSNGAKILNTEQSSGVLTSVNGIRFISMTWVIFCHSIGASLGVSDNMAIFIPDRVKRFTYLAIGNAYVSVDTFFTLSGLLVSYLCLKEMKKRGSAKKFNWAMFYFHRFWRLTPPYMLWLMFYVCLTRYFSNGPLWSEDGLEPDFCKETWWKNLVYVNNLVDTKNQCMGWAWYLANDMQFFVVSPIMLIPLYYSSLFGTLSCAAMILVNFISVGVLTSQSHLNAEIIIAQAEGKNEDVRDVYIKPWCRIGPYAVGVLAGYILYRTDCKLKIPKRKKQQKIFN